MNKFIWQQYLDVSEMEATGYHDGSRTDLVDNLDFTPRFVLDIGCAAGGTGAYVKSKYPGATVWGIEMNKAAAAKAQERLDRVLTGSFDDFCLESEGINPGTIDVVILADVLEHMYNPWKVVTELKRFLSPNGLLIISIPNIRFLPLLDDLAHGYWRYAEKGILDITHVRFFTLKELKRFCYETGYRIEKTLYGIDPTLQDELEQHKKKLPCTIDTGKMVLRDVDHEELMELYSGQFFLYLKPGSQDLLSYHNPKIGCYFWEGSNNKYLNFISQHKLLKSEAISFEKQLAEIIPSTKIELIIISNQQTINNLARTITSASKQYYPNISISVIGAGPTPSGLANNEKIRWIQSSGNIGNDLNTAIQSSNASWSCILHSGDELVEHSILYLVENQLRSPTLSVIYADEDAIGANGIPENPYFKPAPSPDYLLSFDYLGDILCFRNSSLLTHGGFNADFQNGLLREMTLRIAAKEGFSALGHIPDILFRRHPIRSLSASISNLSAEMKQATEIYLKAKAPQAKTLSGLLPNSVRISSRDSEEAIRVVIFATQTTEAMEAVLETYLINQSHKNIHLSILVEASTPTQVIQLLLDLEKIKGDLPVTLFEAPSEVPACIAINEIIRASDEPNLTLIAPGTIPAEPSSLRELSAELARPDVGIVAPRVLDTKGNLTGNALILGCQGVFCGFGAGQAHDSPGHFGRLLVAQNPSALTSECVSFSRKTFDLLGGFDESLDEHAAGIDFCLRAQSELGLRCLWLPEITFISLEHIQRKIPEANLNTLTARWLPQLIKDGFYNPNFSRQTPFALTEKPQASKLRLPWKPLPRLLAFPADNMGCGNYRVMQPFEAAVNAGLIDGYCGFDHYDPFDLGSFDADTLFFQRQVSDEQLNALATYRKFFKTKFVFELDDLITNLPVENIHKKQLLSHMPKRLRSALKLCDRFIVSTETLAEFYRDLHPDIRVVPNRIDLTRWGHLESKRGTGTRPRVGWAGGLSHAGDLAIVQDVVKALADDVDWVFLGMCPDSIRPFVKEFHFGVETHLYPGKLASLNLDLAIAPIAHNDFNRCKSNLKLLEYGALGLPVIASDFGPYQCGMPVTLVKNRPKDWMDAIRDHLANAEFSAQQGESLKQLVIKQYALQDHLDDWLKAWFAN